MASSVIKAHHDWLHFLINERLKDTEPAKVVALTAATTLALAYLYSQLTDKASLIIYEPCELLPTSNFFLKPPLWKKM